MTPLRAMPVCSCMPGHPPRCGDRVSYYAALGVATCTSRRLARSTGFHPRVRRGGPRPRQSPIGGEARCGSGRAGACTRHGLVLDIVPNHVARTTTIRGGDLLRHGLRSTHARWFDVDWDAPGREGRLWLPCSTAG